MTRAKITLSNNINFSLIFNCCNKDLSKYINNKYKVKSSVAPENDGLFFAIDGEKTINYYIWMEKFNWSIAHQGLLHHEIFHASLAIMKDQGLDLNADSEEEYAELHQELTMECLNVLSVNYNKNKA